MSNPDRLDGWGEIEQHLRATRRTIQARGYPVHRWPTGRVYAFAGELLAHEGGDVLFAEHCRSLPRTSVSEAE